MRWRSTGLWALVVLALPATLAARPKVDEGPFHPPTIARAGPKPPWPRRRRTNVEGMRAKGQGLIDLKRWQAEPRSPTAVDEERLARALRRLCAGWMPPKRPLRYAHWILTYSRQFEVDPFLVAALIYRQSRCLPQERNDYGTGLAMIHAGMHGPFIRKRRYRYHLLEGNQWQPKELDLSRFPFVPGNLRRAEPNIYFAAGLLRMWKDQCPAIDAAFRSVPHRHFVSHFIWGDRVRDAGPEDRVLRARRRLVAYYLDKPAEPLGRFQAPSEAPREEATELRLGCPLEAPPRKVTSRMGADRADGARPHRGIDFSSTWGEPVLAVADGEVVLAGLDRKRGPPIQVAPGEASGIKRSEMGPGGLFVMLRHAGGLLSAYMHLSSYSVKAGQKVTRGEAIGIVGKSGVADAGAHLHFELRFGGKHIDPMPHLAPYVFPPDATYQGRRIAAEERRIRRKRRIRRWRQRQAARKAPVP